MLRIRMVIQFSRKNKLELYNALLKEKDLFSRALDDDWMNFLNEIWDLRAMKSEDPRYSDAYGDIVQHTVNNNDWEYDQLFLERLKLLDNDEIFIKFIENVVKPKYRNSEDDILKFVLLINSYIEKEKYTLTILEYDEKSLPIHTINIKTDNHSYFDLVVNKINFYSFKVSSRNYYDFSAHTPPDERPCFVLVHNDGWNDFGWKTLCALFYYGTDGYKKYIGNVKIACENCPDLENISRKFTILDDTFYSLGQDEDYYNNLKELLGRNFESVLFALKDTAFFPEIQDKFERTNAFQTSLLRNDEAEQLLREIKYKIYGFDLNNLYSFKYSFQPRYSKEHIDIRFDFDNNRELPNRIFAIIGKNGAGKTQLITSLPLSISNKKDVDFSPRTPLFSKVIAISYSLFDNFEIPKKTSNFNYVYCGLLNEERELLTPRQQLLRFHKTSQHIFEMGRIDKWRNILCNFIDEEIINTFILESINGIDEKKYIYDREKFNTVKSTLSSGQNILLYTISEIISNIRRDTLLLFDEPETHLHPNAISQLMNVIYELVYEFESYCIITTHSPLIIQELFSRNVFVLEKNANTPYVRKIGIESFGENLTTLTEEVFGNKEINKQYKMIIDRLLTNENSYENIVSKLSSEGVPLNLNVRLYIKSKIKA